MVIKITERSLYPKIIELFKRISSRYGIRIEGAQEVTLPGRMFPDILAEIDGHRVLIQIKIDSIEKLIEDIAKSYPSAKSIGADLIGILFPPEVRRIRMEELEKIYPNLLVRRGLILTPWQGQDLEDIRLIELIESIVKSYSKWIRIRVPVIDYLTIAKVSKEFIEELATVLRKFMGVKRYSYMALSIIGRFDYYKAMLEDFLEEDEMRIYTADIMAYLLAIQLLFLHVVSKKVYNTITIPQISDPLNPPSNLVQQLLNNIRSSRVIIDYREILGALPCILEILQDLVKHDPRITLALAKYIYTFYPLRPEHVKVELFGRIYQFGLPPETRKNLSAFFTRPQASRLLAGLAIESWDEKILDPACGSGTLLAESYQTKLRIARMQGVNLNYEDLHKTFIEKHIIGIDIMQFAKELTTVNLVLQNPAIKVEPRIFVGDGIKKMAHAEEVEEVDPVQVTIEDYLEISRKRYEELILPREGFDVVVMNPPFTRRERIPERERKELEKLLGNIVRGKVGYWAYFFASADNVIKVGGKLAAVTPEEFFAGRASESVRRYMFMGEEYNKEAKTWVKRYDRTYIPEVIIRSGVEVAFSEGVLYRDYLVVFRKTLEQGNKPVIFVILKKELNEISDKEYELVKAISEFSKSTEKFISTEYIDARKVFNINELISKHIGNLKPLVGLNDIRTQELILELLDALSRYPTLRDYENKEYIRIRNYNPGQYTTRGVEDYARRLFVSRYGARGKISFCYEEEKDDMLMLSVKQRKKRFNIPKSACVYSLRSPAGVRQMDITNKEEYAIVYPKAIPSDILKIAGLIRGSELNEAARDIRRAYQDIASNILLARRFQLTSPNIYWLAFFSSNKMLSTAVLINLITEFDEVLNKALTLYLNSSVVLAQLLGFVIETRGAWVDLHGVQVWSHVHIPCILNLTENEKKCVLEMWQKMGRSTVPSLYERIRQRHSIQRSIDEWALKLLGLSNWINRLDEIYDAILYELDAMQRILEESSRERRRHKSIKREEDGKNEERQLSLDMFSNLS